MKYDLTLKGQKPDFFDSKWSADFQQVFRCERI